VLDFAQGNYQQGVLTGDVTIEFLHPPATGLAGVLTLELQQDSKGDYMVAWPENILFAGGQPPILSMQPDAIDSVRIETYDSGQTYRLYVLGLGFARDE